MSSPDRLLNAPPETDLERLRKENQFLTEQRDKYQHALSVLRRQLQPLYSALRAVFGEIDAADIPNPEVRISYDQANVRSMPQRSPVWENWRKQLGGKQAEVIEALETHGWMNVAQLVVATHSAKQTIYETIWKLNKLQLINKNGGKYSLKEMP